MSEEVNRQSKEVVLVTNNSVLKKEFGVQLKCFNDMSLKSISWIWQGWLAVKVSPFSRGTRNRKNHYWVKFSCHYYGGRALA